MNPLKKCGCRVFQSVFRAALPILPYREPKLFHDVTERIPMLQKKGIVAVLIVTDRGIRDNGLTRKLEDALRSGDIHCAVYDGTRANPTVQNVEEESVLYQQKDCQALIAFGGGSAIDCAKALGAYHGRAGFEAFSHIKSIVDKKTWMDLSMRYQPCRKLYAGLLRMFLK